MDKRVVLASEFANVLPPGHLYLSSIPLRQRLYETGCYICTLPARYEGTIG